MGIALDIAPCKLGIHVDHLEEIDTIVDEILADQSHEPAGKRRGKEFAGMAPGGSPQTCLLDAFGDFGGDRVQLSLVVHPHAPKTSAS